MTTFDHREEAFEAAFVHEQEQGFKARARSTRELACWAAGLMGDDPAAVQRYADEIMALRLREGDDASVRARIRLDLQNAGRPTSDAEIARQADELLTQALVAIRAS